MGNAVVLTCDILADNFTRAGEVSSDMKRRLKQTGVDPKAIRKVAIAMYEGEINMVVHASGGLIMVETIPQQIKMILADVGPGTPGVELAMQVGYPTVPDEIRSLDFGVDMGPPNMEKYSDNMEVDTKLGEGTTIIMTVKI